MNSAHLKYIKRGLLFFLPIITLLAVTLFQFSPQYQQSSDSFGFFPLVTTLAAILAIFAAFLAIQLISLNQKLTGVASQRERRQKKKIDDLQKKVDFLSALREMSLVVNEQTDFRSILLTVLHLVEVVLSPQEVLIFLNEEEGKELRPAVYQKESQTYFNDDVPPLPEAQIWVDESLSRRKNLKYFLGDSVVLTHLLAAEKETFGVLAVKMDSHKIEDFREWEQNLEVLSKHIALAIRKPTLYDRAVVDSLTTLYTKRHFVQQIGKHFGLSRRLGKPFSLILIDIDHFKSINDNYGHLSGDNVLHSVGTTIKSSIREYDSAYRYGGEEIAILLPETDIDRAAAIAERIRIKIQSLAIQAEKGEELKITCSLGVSSYNSHHQKYQDLVSEADARLYQAKEGGRNQVRAA